MTVRYTARLSARARILAFGTSTLVLSGILLIIPVVGGYAEPPHAIKSNVQNIALGAPEAPAKNVAVVDASQNPAPEPKATDGPAGVQPPTVAVVPQTTPKAVPSSPTKSSASPSDSTPSSSASPSASSESAPPSASPSSSSPSPAVVPPPGASGASTMVLSAKATQNFSMVGVTWQGATPLAGIAVQVRTKSPSGKWTEWTDMSIDYTQTGKANEPVGTDPFWVGSSAGVEVTVTIQTGIKIDGAKLTLIDPNQQPQDSAGASKPTASAGAGTAQPPVYSRAAWGADESLETWDPEYAPTIKAATIHHTADSNDYSEADVPGMMRSIYYYHAVTRGWGDIGYNVVVDKFGHAWEGRTGGLASTVIGGHAGGFNAYTFGVAMLGNYDTSGVPAATVEMVAKLVAWKFSLYGVDPTGWTQLTQDGPSGGVARFADGQTVALPTVFGHRDVDYTSCPGQYGYSILDSVRARAKQLTQTGLVWPKGSVERVAATSQTSVNIAGWAIDQDDPKASISVAVYRNGTGLAWYPTDQPRTDVNNAYGITGNHGFSINLANEPNGLNNYCVYGIDVEGQGNPQLGCVSIYVGKSPPFGTVDGASVQSQTVTVSGWTIDPSSPANPGNVAIYRNNVGLAWYPVSVSRPDVNSVYSVSGAHGFSVVLDNQPLGTNSYCVFAIDNEGVAANPLIGCKSVTIMSRSPVSSLDAGYSTPGVVRLAGWSYDPDAPSLRTNVAVYRDGVDIAWYQTDQLRPDVNAVFGVAGNHGFDLNLSSQPKGQHTYCVFAIDQSGTAPNPLFGCRVITVL